MLRIWQISNIKFSGEQKSMAVFENLSPISLWTFFFFFFLQISNFSDRRVNVFQQIEKGLS